MAKPMSKNTKGQVSGTILDAVRVAAWLSMLALGACVGFVPAAGPSTDTVMDGASAQTGDPGPIDKPTLVYDMVTLDPKNVAILANQPSVLAFGADITSTPATDVRIGVGDIVSATIFEAQPGGLFIPPTPGASQGNFVNLPPQQIYDDGLFTVPYGGAIQAVGLTPVQLQRAITGSIANRAIEPQAVVSIENRRSDDVSVTGDVNNSARFSIDPGGERLLDAIARAGGPRFPTYESMVILQRGGQSDRALLADILNDPSQNIQLEGGDNVIITHEQRYFLALGAVAESATLTQLDQRFPFDDGHLSLADAIARSGGLADSIANPASVFLFRFEKTAVLRQLGANIAANAPPTFPTVYRADFSNASTLFLANEFPMQDGDIIFISDSPLTDYQKFLSVILPFAQSGSNFRAFNP
jgi:polysaccharide biosynthesis/export protein